MAYPILSSPKPQFFDSSGDVLASGTLTIYAPGTTSAKTYYPTADDADAQTNGATTAITLDSRGEPTNELWGRDGEAYKILLKDSAAATVYTVDDIRLPGHSRRSQVTTGSSDATPTIAESNLFVLNSDNTTITDFDDGNVGDVIFVKAPTSGQTIIQRSTSLETLDQVDVILTGTDDVMALVYDGTVWREFARSKSGSPYTKIATADQTLTNTTLAASTYLNTWYLAPGSFFTINGWLLTTADAASRDLKVDFNVDNAVQASAYSYIAIDAATAGTVDAGEVQAIGTDTTIDIDSTSDVAIHIKGFIQSHASSVTDLDFRVAQGTDAGTTTLKAGSWIDVRPVG